MTLDLAKQRTPVTVSTIDASGMPDRPAGTVTPITSSAASVLLDTVRGGAALMVLLEHFRSLFFVDYSEVSHPGIVIRFLYLASGMGHQAVMVFFVLSGYFITGSISRSVHSGRWSWTSYLVQRLTRLYIVLIPAIILTGILDIAGRSLFGTHNVYQGWGQFRYVILGSVASRDTFQVAIANLFFLQGIFFASFGSNGALWSLANEFWYYLLFPLIFLTVAKETNQILKVVYVSLGLIICRTIGTGILLLFLVWLMGSVVALYPFRIRCNSKSKSAVVIAALCTVAVLALSREHVITNSLLADFLSGAFVAITIALIVASYSSQSFKYNVVAKISSYFSGISYSLYLLHMPLLVFLCAFIIRSGNRWQPDYKHIPICALILLIVMVYCHLIWTVTEAKTPMIRNWLRRWIK